MSHDASLSSVKEAKSSQVDVNESAHEALAEATSTQLDLHTLVKHEAPSQQLLRLSVNRVTHAVPPPHHVVVPTPPPSQYWTGWLPGWSGRPNPAPASGAALESSHGPVLQYHSQDSTSKLIRLPSKNDQNAAAANATSPKKEAPRTIGFRNPWPSWHKPTLPELWAGLDWGSPSQSESTKSSSSTDLQGGRGDRGGGELPEPHTADHVPLRVVQPTFTQPAAETGSAASSDAQQSEQRVGATWLGHAGVLLQMPSLSKKEDLREGATARVEQDPVRLLFDPIFSERCSPTQYFGPARAYASPCEVKDLPRIDAVLISHSHYDHLDLATITELWHHNKRRIRFFVPLGLKDWFVGTASKDGGDQHAGALGIPPDRIEELDWWDSVTLTAGPSSAASFGTDDSSLNENHVKITCTPAQHGSGRYGLDAGTSLWASWFVEHAQRDDSVRAKRGPGDGEGDQSYKVFFGGDTGLQFHGAEGPKESFLRRKRAVKARRRDHTAEGGARKMSKPILQELESEPLSEASASSSSSSLSASTLDTKGASPPEMQYPPCPTFTEIALRLGSPDLLFLPISVGATLSFLKSYDPLASWTSPKASSTRGDDSQTEAQGWVLFPNISPGLTSANHMGPWDACRVLKMMQNPNVPDAEFLDGDVHAHGDSRIIANSSGNRAAATSARRAAPLALAIHWGTFVSGEAEAHSTMQDLKEACSEQSVVFSRNANGAALQKSSSAQDATSNGRSAAPEFTVVDHGHTMWLDR
ncbi:Predicted Zn-dependent hydrolase (beta-lactamase superfamily) [Ceraceosorus bombacis]|uniref:Predicted Zn-dependent hydrolase (Beta-lactamase superfamily) n=1 Tax=Ceraceosorus bombacis TaxID=401625 RepID=A0A0P1BDP8_9BASI|nr:Predicted Zn-dependent hydrolase (beta-lactamase superfamily) [Ceraceosorus bombacis]